MSTDKFIKNKTVLITLISACAIVIVSLGIRQTFGMFYFDFSTDLGITLSQFGFALGLQMFLWGAFAPWFGVITDKYGGHIAVFIGFVFYLSGILMLVSEYNTGLYFVTGIGVLIGVALGGTAISIPVSVVAKHFHDSNRTVAIGIVTAAGSFGYFVSPVFTRYSLVEFGWESTLLIFAGLLSVNLSFSQKCGTYPGSLQEDIKKYPHFYQSLEKKNTELKLQHEKVSASLRNSKSEEGLKGKFL